MIVFAGEQCLRFQFGKISVPGTQLPVQFFQQVLFLLGIGLFLSEVNVGFKIAVHRRELFVGGNLLLGALAFAQNALCEFLIGPKIGIGDAGFKGL